MGRDREERADGGIERCSLAGSWIAPDAIRSLLELNRDCLELLAEQAATQSAQSNVVLRQHRELWLRLSPSARDRLAACPFLLADLGFADARRWTGSTSLVRDRETLVYAPFFTVPRAAVLARQVFSYAWDLSRTQEPAARILLAMPAHCTGLISSLTVRQIHELAEVHVDWLIPRWHRKAKVWREMLIAAGAGESVGLQRAHNHGYDLIEAEARAASAQLARSGSHL
jgi:hypothetical protein